MVLTGGSEVTWFYQDVDKTWIQMSASCVQVVEAAMQAMKPCLLQRKGVGQMSIDVKSGTMVNVATNQRFLLVRAASLAGDWKATETVHCVQMDKSVIRWRPCVLREPSVGDYFAQCASLLKAFGLYLVSLETVQVCV